MVVIIVAPVYTSCGSTARNWASSSSVSYVPMAKFSEVRSATAAASGESMRNSGKHPIDSSAARIAGRRNGTHVIDRKFDRFLVEQLQTERRYCEDSSLCHAACFLAVFPHTVFKRRAQHARGKIVRSSI